VTTLIKISPFVREIYRWKHGGANRRRYRRTDGRTTWERCASDNYQWRRQKNLL